VSAVVFMDYALLLKLTGGQFENAKIKVQNAKLRNVLSKIDLHLTFATNRSD